MKTRSLGLIALASTAVIAASGLAVATAVAQDGEGTETTEEKACGPGAHRGELMTAVAAELGIDVDELEAAFESARQQMLEARLDEAVTSGRLTEEQAERIRSGRPGFGGPKGHMGGPGFGGPKGHMARPGFEGPKFDGQCGEGAVEEALSL